MEKLIEDIYGTKENYQYSQIYTRKSGIYSEMKGEEYKTEDLLKAQSKLNLTIFNKLANKDKSLTMCYSNME